MSRGRGGLGRGRGGFGSMKRSRGQEESWQYDFNLIVDTKPREFFPEIYIPKPTPHSRRERAQYRLLQKLRRRVRDGPLYTVMDEHAHVGRPNFKKAANFNPFEDMPSYTQKYKPPSLALPKFDTRRYDIDLFPTDLWSSIKPDHGKASSKSKQSAAKRLGSYRTTGDQSRRRTDLEEDLAKNRPGDEDDEELQDEEDDDMVSDSNPEEDFEDDDSDMAEDYNAESYFYTGEDDVDGLDGDGGDDGGFD